MSNILKRNITDLSVETLPKIPKTVRSRMMAILLMYSGFGYFGMQRNVGFQTIEGEMMDALLDQNYISKESYDSPKASRFQRASKTDKNVSAMGQVCSMILPEDVSCEKLNAKLPSQIRVIDIMRTTKNFNCKSRCDHRMYKYTCPSFTFSPKGTQSEKYSEYRITSDVLDQINNVLKKYKGTHNFHNFTSKRKPEDKSCNRYIIDVKCNQPTIRGKYEYVDIDIVGQSFMIHQIRKMIGLCIAIVKGFCQDDMLDKIFELKKYDIPRAPGLGLILNKVIYTNYNRNYGDKEGRKSIDWDRYEEQINRFSEEYVYKHIYQKEEEEKSMETWLESLDLHTYKERLENGDSNINDDSDNESETENEKSRDLVESVNKQLNSESTTTAELNCTSGINDVKSDPVE